MGDEQNIYNPVSEGMSIKDLLVNNDEEVEQSQQQQIYKSENKYVKTARQNKKHILKKQNKEIKYKYYTLIVELLILLTIYVIMSQEFFISFTSKYVKYLKPQQDGTTSFIGVLIYGIILCVLYTVLRLAILERNI